MVKQNAKVAAAITAILSAPTAQGVYAADEDTPVEVEAVIVTAQRRAENIQNVPIAIQALTGDTLNQLKVTTLDDFVKYLPSVTTAKLGPGQGSIYMRGLAVATGGGAGEASVGPWPNVAVYLDEQSTQIPGRNLDVYATDLERVEVLEGPQGTLFGAGAQAGVLRYITNKPKLGVTEASVAGGYDTTAHGAQSSLAQGTLNVPLGEKLALRAVIYDDSRGGYIDNVPSTFTRQGTDQGFAFFNRSIVPADSVVINNYDLAPAKDINPVTYKGIRVGVKYQLTDDWDVLITQSYQDMNSSGVFYEMPAGSEGQPLNPLEVTLFNNGVTEDKFENTAWTLNGKVGPLDLVYTGAYLVRDVSQTQDYTNYARGVVASYYQCTGGGFGFPPAPDKCYSPSSTWHDTTHNTNQSHEFRISTPSSWMVSGLAGAFWEERKVDDDTEWLYKTVPPCSPGGPSSCFLSLDPAAIPALQGASLNNPDARNSHTAFFDDFKRDYKQTAFFISTDWHILSSLTLGAGTRYFEIKNELLGASLGSSGCKVNGTGQTGDCTTPFSATNLNAQDPHSSTANGFKSRVNLSWHPGQEVLLYATWSQGYRPGGFNRGSTCGLTSVTTGNPQWCTPKEYQSDTLTNTELGWKTTLFDNRLQFNGSVYKEDWKNVQTPLFDPQLNLFVTSFVNGPNYRVKGVEISVLARPVGGLTVQGSMSYNKTELTNSPQLINNYPGDSNNGRPVTTAVVFGQQTNVVDVYGPRGQQLASAPQLQGNARARYDWPIGDYDYYTQIGFNHQGSSFSSATTFNRYEMPSWTTYDASMGVAKGGWTVDLVGTNLTDVNRSLFTTRVLAVLTEVPQRPRTVGIRIGYMFSEKGH